MTASSQSIILPPRARFDYEQISLCICSSDSCRTSDGMLFAAAGSPCRTATTRAVAWFQVGAVFNRTKTAVGGGSGSLVFRQSGDLISTPERLGLIRCLRAKSLREVTVN